MAKQSIAFEASRLPSQKSHHFSARTCVDVAKQQSVQQNRNLLLVEL
jgi:hypothetical protein